jgi:hypothetical protein
MKPWCSGPRELLQIAHRLSAEGRPESWRASLLLIDNAVEVTAKTFLTLPKRVTGLKITKSEREAAFATFPETLTCLEKNGGDRTKHLALGDIEWFHSLRNRLYHEGTGLTVSKENVDMYFAIASQLFEALFDEKLNVRLSGKGEADIAKFLSGWTDLERGLIAYSEFIGDTYGRTPGLREGLRLLADEEELPRDIHARINELQLLRSKLVHGQVSPEKAITPAVLDQLRGLQEWLASVDEQYKLPKER